MQHPSKPLAKTRQGTLARAAASRPLAGRASGRRLFRRQLAGH